MATVVTERLTVFRSSDIILRAGETECKAQPSKSFVHGASSGYNVETVLWNNAAYSRNGSVVKRGSLFAIVSWDNITDMMDVRVLRRQSTSK